MEKKQTNKTMVTLSIMLITFLSSLEGTIVSTAIPKIVSDLGGMHLMNWVVSIYLLTTAVATPIVGKLSDLYGRKLMFICGMILFLIGSMLSGMSQSMEQLIVFRAIQGLGAGAILPVTMIIIGDIYSFEERAKIQGWISGIWGISGILGPLTGGLMVDYVSWHWIFYFNVPFGLLSILFIVMYLHEHLDKKKQKVDYLGIALFTVSMTSFMFALLSGGNQYAWNSPFMIGILILAVVTLALFLVVEYYVKEPMLPLRLFAMRLISVSNLSGFLLSAILVGITIYLPLWIQGVAGKGATDSGFTLIPLSVCWPVGAALAGRWFVRMGVRSTTLIGVSCLLAAAAGLYFVGIHTPYLLLVALMGLFGLGFGFAFTSYTITVQSAVGWQMRGTAMASYTFLRTLGQTLGISVFGMLFNMNIQSYKTAHSQNEALQQLDTSQVFHGDQAASLPPGLMEQLREMMVYGIHHIFISLLIIAAIALAVTWILPKRFKVDEDNPCPKGQGSPKKSRRETTVSS